MIKFYLEEFRAEDYSGGELFPFEEKVVRYAIQRVALVPRNLINALRQALIYGSIEKWDIIGENFLLKHHKNMFGGLDNRWQGFKTGKFG